jgi:hypothetical protein
MISWVFDFFTYDFSCFYSVSMQVVFWVSNFTSSTIDFSCLCVAYFSLLSMSSFCRNSLFYSLASLRWDDLDRFSLTLLF